MSDRYAVVGGGIIGLSTAYHLARRGAEVVVLEAAAIGQGCSSVNAGWICPSLAAPLPGPGMPLTGLRSLVDPDGAFRLAPAHLLRLAPWLVAFARRCNSKDQTAGLRATARLASGAMESFDEMRDDGVDFTMRTVPLLFAGLTEASVVGYLRGLASLEEFGYDIPAEASDGETLRTREPALSAEVRAGFVVDGERTVEPAGLLAGLRHRLAAMGVVVREGQVVASIEPDRQSKVRLTGPGLSEHFAGVVVAAGAWSHRLLRPLGLKLPLEAAKGYSLEVEPRVSPVHSLYLTEAKVATTATGPTGSRLRLAGTMELAGLDTGVSPRRVSAMASKAARYLLWEQGSESPPAAGLRPLLPDGLPAIGRAGAPGVFVATGHSMLGVTLGPVTGRALTTLVLDGRLPAELGPFDPRRF